MGVAFPCGGCGWVGPQCGRGLLWGSHFVGGVYLWGRSAIFVGVASPGRSHLVGVVHVGWPSCGRGHPVREGGHLVGVATLWRREGSHLVGVATLWRREGGHLVGVATLWRRDGGHLVGRATSPHRSPFPPQLYVLPPAAILPLSLLNSGRSYGSALLALLGLGAAAPPAAHVAPLGPIGMGLALLALQAGALRAALPGARHG